MMNFIRFHSISLGRNFRSHSSNQNFVNHAKSGPENFIQDFAATHLETSPFQRALLAFGSAVFSISDPSRGDMIAVMGETTGTQSLEYIKTKMCESSEGRKIIEEKPRISSSTIDLERLKMLPEGTLGRAYSNFLEKYNYTPDTRMAVRFVDDLELAYVIQRYREVHDLFHTMFDMPTNMLGEVTVKWVEAIQTKLPMCVGGAVFGPARLKPKLARMYSTSSKPQLLVTSPWVEEHDNVSEMERKHPGVMRVPCVELPQEIANTVVNILKEEDVQTLKTDGQALRQYLASRKPPVNMKEWSEKREHITRDVYDNLSIHVDESHLSAEQREYLEKIAESQVNKTMKQQVYNWQQIKYDAYMCLQYLHARAPADFAVLTKIFSEIQKRDKTFSPMSLFDFGSGVGTVSWAAHALWSASIKEYFTVDSSAAMNDLALLILKHNNPKKEPFIKTLFQRQFLPASLVRYDLVVSAFSLMEHDSSRSRSESILNLWNRTQKYLVIIETGTNAGFQLVSEARDFVRHVCESSGVHFHVFAPCPHELQCPRIIDRTPCNFSVKFQPLRIRERALMADCERYSYVVIKRGRRSEDEPQWPRIVRPVLKKHKHTICRMCTEHGKLEEAIISPGKHGKGLYRCSRYTDWGDLFPGTVKTATQDTS